ncbi:RHS repeat-associated core domain-containing protein [Streptococcus sp. DTU_2020_1001019_1_SI_AUS_MUR_006]|uniref:RHS repeat-associated core domain-containing protein n=1 Tax=Streptococcus sp. DTU_2020_1001019_1_SI_AUS_MUR_006 TaxID=3077584 RepID=UPI00397D14C4
MFHREFYTITIGYNFSGTRKTSTDLTAQPFAYNGKDRDDIGLDYLRASYYDSQGGTFLTEDGYPGENTEPLSQNRYSYVQNTPVNYTDPSVHFWNSIKKGWNYVKKAVSNEWNGENILMEEINNEYKSNSFKKKRTF